MQQSQNSFESDTNLAKGTTLTNQSDVTDQNQDYDQPYENFDEQDCPSVIIPTEQVDDRISTPKTISFLQLVKENIKKLKPTNKEDFFNSIIALIATLILSAGIYAEEKNLKEEMKNFDLNETIAIL